MEIEKTIRDAQDVTQEAGIYSKKNSICDEAKSTQDETKVNDDNSQTSSNNKSSVTKVKNSQGSCKKTGSLWMFGDSNQLSIKNDSTKGTDKSVTSNIDNTNESSSQVCASKLVNLHDNIPKHYEENKSESVCPLIHSQNKDLESLLEIRTTQVIKWMIATTVLSYLSATLLGIILLILIFY